MIRKGIFIVFMLCVSACNKQKIKHSTNTELSKDEITNTYLKKGAWNYHYLDHEFTTWVDKGITQDSTIAYLWQQKALPLWKQHKYDLAIMYYNKAIQLDPEQWLSRLGYLKCIFAKQYHSALEDLNTYIKHYGSTHEQDHALEFYQAICYLQLENYNKALSLLQKEISAQEMQHGEDWVHYLDRFYLAIIYFELEQYANAILEFDKVLQTYPNFSDAQFYQAICYHKLGDSKSANIIAIQGQLNHEYGRSFSEDASIYVNYPYQVTWQWDILQTSLLKQPTLLQL